LYIYIYTEIEREGAALTVTKHNVYLFDIPELDTLLAYDS